MVSDDLDQALRSAIISGGSEPEIVRDYVAAAAQVSTPPNLNVRTTFIHQRPYAFFIQPALVAGRTKCELGDILYVYKRFNGSGNVSLMMAAFVQVKKGASHWQIEPHQLEFWSNIKRIQFRFGNSVYKRGGYKPTIYNGLPVSSSASQYLLIDAGSPSSLSYCTDRIAQSQKLYQQSFSVHLDNPVSCREAGTPLCKNHDSHLRFLTRFCAGKGGEELVDDFRQVVELVYKRVGWVLDPPEEFADNFIEDGRGLGVVEITNYEGEVELREPDDDFGSSRS